jgi:hypothetical protein
VKNLSQIAWRLLKVVYVLFLLFGLLVALFAWSSAAPLTENTYGNYLVTCDNGKTFDPTSKPIDTSGASENLPGFHYSSYVEEPYPFNANQIKAECKYGNAFLIGYGTDLDRVNYNLTYKTYPHDIRTVSDQISGTVISIAVYYLILEILRRTFMYIFLGKKFISLPIKKRD